MKPPSETVVQYLRKKWVLAADTDYIAARMCEEAFLGRQFFWNAAQAIEKYCKAILVLNGQSIKKIKHQTLDHLKLLDPQILDLLPKNIDLSQSYKLRPSLQEYGAEGFQEALRRFETQGSPDNRYRETHLRLLPYDLQKLDFVVYYLRRICYPLLTKPDLLQELRSSPESSANSDISLFQNHKLGKGIRENALKRCNVVFYPEIARTGNYNYSIQTEVMPAYLAQALNQFSETDIKWLKEMTSETF